MIITISVSLPIIFSFLSLRFCQLLHLLSLFHILRPNTYCHAKYQTLSQEKQLVMYRYRPFTPETSCQCGRSILIPHTHLSRSVTQIINLLLLCTCHRRLLLLLPLNNLFNGRPIIEVGVCWGVAPLIEGKGTFPDN